MAKGGQNSLIISRKHLHAEKGRNEGRKRPRPGREVDTEIGRPGAAVEERPQRPQRREQDESRRHGELDELELVAGPQLLGN